MTQSSTRRTTHSYASAKETSIEPPSQSKGKAFKGSGLLIGFIVPFLLIISWQIACLAGVFKPYQLPSPVAIYQTTIKLARGGQLLPDIEITVLRLLGGFIIGTVAATILGVVVGMSRVMERLMDPTIQAFRSIPSLAWVPLFILWMSIGEASKITLIAVGVFFPVYLNIVSGIHGVDKKLIDVGKIYGLSWLGQVRRIIFPATLPSFLVGLRSGMGLGWMFVVAAEIMGASKGLGYLMIQGQNSYSPAMVIVSIVFFALLGKLSDWGLKSLEHRLLRWQDRVER